MEPQGSQEDLMASQQLKELYTDELRDLFNAENQLVKALPKLAKAATSADLKAGFEEHLEQTKGHVERLEAIFKSLGEDPKGKKCKGMEGLVEEGSEAIEEYEGSVRDVALIGAAQRVEHYEMAGYGTIIALAGELGEDKHAGLLEKTLEEEKETDAKLTALSETVNAEAAAQDDDEEKAKPKQAKKSSHHAA
jgi:ferritin-like metal-binding protein YciE